MSIPGCTTIHQGRMTDNGILWSFRFPWCESWGAMERPTAVEHGVAWSAILMTSDSGLTSTGAA